MNIFKNHLPLENGFYWYRGPITQPIAVRVSTVEDVTGEDEPQQALLFFGDTELRFEWELAEKYELAGPIFPPTDWPIDFDKWPTAVPGDA